MCKSVGVSALAEESASPLRVAPSIDREVQTEISLPQRMMCVWQGHISERLAVIDGAPLRNSRRRVMSSDSDSSEADLNVDETEVSANDPRNDQAEGEGEREGSTTPPTMDVEKTIINTEVSPARSDNSMFDFDELEQKSPAQDDHMVQRVRLLSRNGHVDDSSIPDAVMEEVPVVDDPEFCPISEGVPDEDDGLHIGGREEFKRLVENQSVRPLVVNQSAPATESTVVLPRADEPGRGETPKKRRGRALMTLPATKVGGRRLKMSRGITVDSGAADNVMPRKILRKWMRVRPSKASKAGVHYVAANNARIPNEGEVDFAFQTKDGQQHSWLFQVAGVNKVLASVSSLVDTGHVVTFEKDERTGMDLSFITHKSSGRSIKMRRERNIWTIDAFVNDESDFSRQE